VVYGRQKLVLLRRPGLPGEGAGAAARPRACALPTPVLWAPPLRARLPEHCEGSNIKTLVTVQREVLEVLELVSCFKL